MKIQELLVVLPEIVKAREPVLVTGSPGVGKTEICLEVAKGLGMDTVVSHPVVLAPDEVKGFMIVVDGKPIHVCYPNIEKLFTATGRVLWLIDDIGQAMQSVQAAFMQLILARAIDGKRLGEGVSVVACTNRRKDGAGVSGIITALLGRFSIFDLEPDLASFENHVIPLGFPAAWIAYLRLKPDQLNQPYKMGEMANVPNPRNWVKAFEVMPKGGFNLLIARSRLGEAVAEELGAFVAMAEKMPKLPDTIIKNPKWMDKDASLMMVVCTALSRHPFHDAFLEFADNLFQTGNEPLGILLLRDLIRANSGIAANPLFIKLATDHNIAEFI